MRERGTTRHTALAITLALVVHVGFVISLSGVARSDRTLDDDGRIEFVIREVASQPVQKRAPSANVRDGAVVVQRDAPTRAPSVGRGRSAETAPIGPDDGARPSSGSAPSVEHVVDEERARDFALDGSDRELRVEDASDAPDDILRLRSRPRTLLERVVVGRGDRASGDAIVDGVRTAPPRVSDEERLAARLNDALAVKSALPRGAFGKSGFVASVDGGYVRRDLETGKRPPESSAMAGDILGTMDRSGVFRDQETPLVKRALKDDLIPTTGGGFVYAPQGGGFTAVILSDGAVVFDEDLASTSLNSGPEAYERLGLPAKDYTRGVFSFTDAVHRLSGSDPYRAAKMCFLDDTQEIRDGLRERHRERMLAASIAALRRRLDTIWNDASMTASERRRVLFETWDECNEGDSGRIARDVVETYIRAHLPRASALAFTDEELAQLNGTRMTSEPFAPYGT
jgi:hypothetical protein